MTDVVAVRRLRACTCFEASRAFSGMRCVEFRDGAIHIPQEGVVNAAGIDVLAHNCTTGVDAVGEGAFASRGAGAFDIEDRGGSFFVVVAHERMSHACRVQYLATAATSGS